SAPARTRAWAWRWPARSCRWCWRCCCGSCRRWSWRCRRRSWSVWRGWPSAGWPRFPCAGDVRARLTGSSLQGFCPVLAPQRPFGVRGARGECAMGAKLDYAAVFNAIPTPCAVVTPDLEIVAVNDACLKETRRTRAELVGQSFLTAFGSPPDFVDALRASIGRVASTKDLDVVPLVRHDIRPGGTGLPQERYWTLVQVPVLGRDGELSWIVTWAEDVTPLVRDVPSIPGE